MGNAISNCCDKPPNIFSSVRKPEKQPAGPDPELSTCVDELSKKKAVSLSDFVLEAKLGQGGYGAVFRATKISNNKEYALKVVKKKLFKNAVRIKDALNEKNIMISTRHPFIVRLHYAFQDKRSIYYVMDYLKGGALSKYIKKQGHFSELVAKFYAAQVVLALKYLHEEKKIVYRDLKPDNILLDDFGYIKLSDFGLSTIGVERLTSICGTYEYIAPEILRGEEYTCMVDYFSLGCLLFEMIYGKSPFTSIVLRNTHSTIIKNILAGRYEFHRGIVVSTEVKDLILKLLDRNPRARLGFNGAAEIQNHPFFDNVDWEALHHRQLEPPFEVQIFTGHIEHFNRFTDAFNEKMTNWEITGFSYESEGGSINGLKEHMLEGDKEVQSNAD